MNTKTIKTLMTWFEQSNLQTFKLQQDDMTLELTKPTQPTIMAGPPPSVEPVQAPLPQGTPTEPPKDAVKAPLVGIFYEAPGPDQAAFVSVGAKVKKGQTLCIVEAMKVMNEIAAPNDGVVREILVKNGEMVMYDQPLMVIE